MDRDKMSNLYKEPSIDASYEVSVHLAFIGEDSNVKCKITLDDGRQMMAKAHMAFCIDSYFCNF